MEELSYIRPKLLLTQRGNHHAGTMFDWGKCRPKKLPLSLDLEDLHSAHLQQT